MLLLTLLSIVSYEICTISHLHMTKLRQKSYTNGKKQNQDNSPSKQPGSRGHTFNLYTLPLLKKDVKDQGKENLFKYFWMETSRGSPNWGEKHHFPSFHFQYFMHCALYCALSTMSQKYLALLHCFFFKCITSQEYRSY